MKIARANLVDAAISALRTEILNGRYAPGARLTEIGLAAEMGIGRSTVRAALLELEKDDLVYRSRYSAWSVAELDPRVIWEVYTLRGALEGLAARIVAQSLSAEGKAMLLAAYQRLQKAEVEGEPAQRIEADLAFHRAIVRLSGHARLGRDYDVLAHKIEWIYRWSEQSAPARIALPDWHKPVLDAVLAGDGDAAERAIRSIIEASLTEDLAELIAASRKRA